MLTIFWIKFFAIIPHAIILIFLGIAQWVVAFVAQFVVAFKGEYPAGMHEFVTGVLRWQTRVAGFVLSVNDRYPPFTLRAIDDYPLDVVAERPERAQPRLRGLHDHRADPGRRRRHLARRLADRPRRHPGLDILSERHLQLPVQLPVVRR